MADDKLQVKPAAKPDALKRIPVTVVVLTDAAHPDNIRFLWHDVPKGVQRLSQWASIRLDSEAQPTGDVSFVDVLASTGWRPKSSPRSKAAPCLFRFEAMTTAEFEQRRAAH